jgi:hypothetical protein
MGVIDTGPFENHLWNRWPFLVGRCRTLVFRQLSEVLRVRWGDLWGSVGMDRTHYPPDWCRVLCEALSVAQHVPVDRDSGLVALTDLFRLSDIGVFANNRIECGEAATGPAHLLNEEGTTNAGRTEVADNARDHFHVLEFLTVEISHCTCNTFPPLAGIVP